MLSRRSFLGLLGASSMTALGMPTYAVAIEPRFRLVVTRYDLPLPGLGGLDRPIRLAALADIHACDPWMPLSRVERIVELTNEFEPDIVVLLGDYVAGLRHFRTAVVPMRDWSRALGRLTAPLGVHSVLGNHDWWVDAIGVRAALEDNGIAVLQNAAHRIDGGGRQPIWIAGLDDQLAIPCGRGRFEGVHDLRATLSGIPDDGSPVILLAHEPDIFDEVPGRVALTLSGHTHGGQVCIPGLGRSVVPSRYGGRYAYGHVADGDRNLIVSGGLGCSMLPVRFGVPPEIVLIELG